MCVIPARVLTVTPTSGAPGTQVTISGSGFGSTQGTSMAWLGSTKANVVSWSDTQIMATVAAGSTTGTAQVQRSGVWSNSIAFAVASPTISSVTPLSGGAGTTVTITGSGFGSSQGTGPQAKFLPALIEGGLLAHHGLHSADTGRELSLYDIQFRVGGKLSDVATGTEVVRTHHRHESDDGKDGLGALFLVLSMMAARARTGPLRFRWRRMLLTS